MNAQHTPTPWRYSAEVGSDWLDVENDCVEVCRIPKDAACAYADAAFIVRACNAHDELVAALRVFVDRAEWCRKSGNEVQQAACVVFADRIAAAYAALAKAGAA